MSTKATIYKVCNFFCKILLGFTLASILFLTIIGAVALGNATVSNEVENYEFRNLHIEEESYEQIKI